MINLQDKKILVTGATGFIGGRLVERLVLEEGAQVRALVRNYNNAAWLSRTSAELILGDITNLESLRPALVGCDIVFHCAAMLGGNPEQMYKVNVKGTENLLNVAQEMNISRFIHLSSFAVYGRNIPNSITESSLPNPGSDPYAESKFVAEQLVQKYCQEYHLPTVILRPTIVYGPRSKWWTIDPVERIKENQLVVIGRGGGIANIIYVDDVINVLLNAASANGVEGEVFLISGEEHVTWGDFFGFYARLLNKELPSWPTLLAVLISTFTDKLDELIRWVYCGRDHLEGSRFWFMLALRGFRKLIYSPLYKVRKSEVKLFSQKKQVDVTKAKRLLDYRSEWPLAIAMKETECWLKSQDYITTKDS